MVKVAVAIFIVLSLAFFGFFAYYYVKYDRIITRQDEGADLQQRREDFRAAGDGSAGTRNIRSTN